jgi:hypothetical protein
LNAVKGIRIISEVIRLELQRNVRLKLDVVSAKYDTSATCGWRIPNDPLYRFHQWQANLRVLGVTEIKYRSFPPRIRLLKD